MITDARLEDLRLRARSRVAQLPHDRRDDLAVQAVLLVLVRDHTMDTRYRRTVSQLISDAAPSYARELRRLADFVHRIITR